MGFKDNFKRMLQREMFYVVLFICLCVVAVAAVYVSRNNAKISKDLAKAPIKTEEKITEPNNEPTLVEEKLSNIKEMQVAQVPKSTVQNKDNKTQTDKEQPNNEKASSKASNPAPAFKMIMPVEGEITKILTKKIFNTL
ncbi:hypothetical protein [Caloramator sp. Dgby_cultured_2]|uniref:hypothetical protein n=1 Tax=Caloramator sp. Dgby_cultured_2 TaxID=3029174 RepID=UPI00237EB914|nr:hypothetical protein [Caloramator sp. Dgby_cultured_2]WDU82574.1 hypothetical protein PWK10_13390 [Caloramator sp. Dgby_cultured_2]